jgi:2-dehydropantoate 2-reductase
MKILIMGAGAIGGCYGGLLARSSEDVVLLARGDNLNAIRERGMQVDSETFGSFTVRPQAVDVLDGTWTADLIMFCVKGYHNEQALSDMSPAVGDSTTILTLQNGIGGGEQIAKRFGSGSVLLGAAYIDAERTAPGMFAQRGSPPRIVLGEESGEATERAKAIADVLRRADIEAEVSPNVLTALWSKLIYICALSGMTCITRASFSEVLETPETHAMTMQVMTEALKVGQASGVPLDDGLVDSVMAGFQEEKGGLISSMHTDLMAGNPLEVSLINGAVARIGKEVGVNTPVNSMIATCLTIADKRARGTATG